MITLQGCKDQIARKYGWADYEDWNKALLININRLDFDREVAKLYAIEKVKEALKVVAELMELDEWDILEINDIETKLIENIKNEI